MRCAATGGICAMSTDVMNDRPLSANEAIKADSRFLRGTIAEGLTRVETGALADDDQQLTKFHGIYLQDDRDLRAERGAQKMEKAFIFMARLRVPGGILTPRNGWRPRRIARERGNGTLRLTTRQTIQFHGIIKSNLRPLIQGLNDAMLDTIAACGDVNRNVIASVNPWQSAAPCRGQRAGAARSARTCCRAAAPGTRSGSTASSVAGGEEEDEPIYGRTYLPRKFKIGVALPPHNDVDVFAHDLGFIAIEQGGRIVGYNVVVGGGMGMTHGEPDTFPRTGDVIGFCSPEQAVDVAEKVVTVQRDYGDRSDRKHARLKYTIERMGLEALPRGAGTTAWLCAGAGAGFRLHRQRRPARLGGRRGRHVALHAVRRERPRARCRTHLLAGCMRSPNWTSAASSSRRTRTWCSPTFRRTRRPRSRRCCARTDWTRRSSGLRRNALACVALPTCGLALAESERYLPALITRLEDELERSAWREDDITIRMTGCPNGCARPTGGDRLGRPHARHLQPLSRRRASTARG